MTEPIEAYRIIDRSQQIPKLKPIESVEKEESERSELVKDALEIGLELDTMV